MDVNCLSSYLNYACSLFGKGYSKGSGTANRSAHSSLFLMVFKDTDYFSSTKQLRVKMIALAPVIYVCKSWLFLNLISRRPQRKEVEYDAPSSQSAELSPKGELRLMATSIDLRSVDRMIDITFPAKENSWLGNFR